MRIGSMDRLGTTVSLTMAPFRVEELAGRLTALLGFEFPFRTSLIFLRLRFIFPTE
jgi:hypothetical protein